MQINSHKNVLVTQNQYLQNKVNELQSLLRSQNVQARQTFPSRKRFRSNDEDEPETMDTNEHPKDFLSESDSEESDTDVANEVEDSITDFDISLTNTDRPRNRYLKALEKTNPKFSKNT